MTLSIIDIEEKSWWKAEGLTTVFSMVKIYSVSFSKLPYSTVGMVKELIGGYKIKYHANELENDPIEIDFTPPFRFLD